MIGLCLPPRPLPGTSPVPPERWGCLRAPVVDAIWDQLPDRFLPVDFRDAVVRCGEVWAGEVALHELDALIWYCEVDRSPGAYELEVLRTLAARIPVHPHPDRWAVAMDKFRAHLALRAAGLPVPDFALLGPGHTDEALALLDTWGAVALKPRVGAWGEGVLLVDHPATLRDVLGFVEASVGGWPAGGVLVERWLDNDPAGWTSVTVIHGEPLYGYRKRAEKWVDLPGGRRKVFDAGRLGGQADLVRPSPEQARIAAAAAATLDVPFVGFDLIATASGPVIVDANTSPGNYPELYAQVGRDLPTVFAQAALALAL